ncbi:MAG: hypothetical protein IJ833_00640 [Lachnospiraceae bacterium]|nr:hypothetical protein [Lachnospiraceae bacterium]
MSEALKKLVSIVAGCTFLTACFFLGEETARLTAGRHVRVQEPRTCVVIDAGHGGDKLRKA